MKREGRQHGMVRAYRILPNPLNPRPETRHVNRFDSPATAGSFTRVSTKPTNHSKFTGKCGQPRCNGCHLSPACKAKDKTKGHQKNKSNDIVSNHRLLTWRVVDPQPGFVLSGHYSATKVLDQLEIDHEEHYDDDDGYDYDYDEEVDTITNDHNDDYDSWCLV